MYRLQHRQLPTWHDIISLSRNSPCWYYTVKVWHANLESWQHRCGSISCRLCRKKSHKSEAVIQTLTRNTAKICGPKNSSGTNCIIFRHEIYIFRSNFLIFIFLSIFSFIPLRIFINYLTCSLYWFKKKLTAW